MLNNIFNSQFDGLFSESSNFLLPIQHVVVEI